MRAVIAYQNGKAPRLTLTPPSVLDEQPSTQPSNDGDAIERFPKQ
jgi:hypothetical protein